MEEKEIIKQIDNQMYSILEEYNKSYLDDRNTNAAFRRGCVQMKKATYNIMIKEIDELKKIIKDKTK